MAGRMKKQQTVNLDAIRAKWQRTVVDGNDVPTLLAHIDELECECGEAWEGVLDAALIHAELVRARDEARAQLAELATKKEKP